MRSQLFVEYNLTKGLWVREKMTFTMDQLQSNAPFAYNFLQLQIEKISL